MIRKKKAYKNPKKPYEKERIEGENALVKKYGLKNKTEVWKTLAKVNYYRGRAKALAKLPLEEQEVLLNKLKALGLKTETSADVLDLKVEDLLERRLPTVVAKKKIANTTKHARQLVVHKKIIVDGNIVNSPSFLVPIHKEDKISIKEKKKIPKQKPKVEEAPAQETETPAPKTETSEQPSEKPKEEKTETPEKSQEPVNPPKKIDNNEGSGEKSTEETKNE